MHLVIEQHMMPYATKVSFGMPNSESFMESVEMWSNILVLVVRPLDAFVRLPAPACVRGPVCVWVRLL